MPFQCIGQSRDGHGKITRCSAESETPTGKWDVFLCPKCANSAPSRHSRPQLAVEREDRDKPNFDEDGVEFFPVRASQDEIDLGDLDALEELEPL